mmetsp:Transcript_19510/g.22703  ORF Transcript_19510/g.22703 Transcript_19510/m.22703 type:complete len:92 (-) Transcript_19510:26-301(-)|eukprot:CAMPEP_0168337724 /NCGR_PEP_ID=MMETSP0213-20121227/12373_1 /TAXON_ID=151035 /ORGANISM="Euplotes harpa, Strain FSP1.4" /LENGTH=91 /DNA_ID=CAMNT_0008343293 /DNA_START=243 /DNA_END=518 /DNA_ORIENTATION=-
MYKLDALVMKKETEDDWVWESHPDIKNFPENVLQLKFKRAHTHPIGTNYLLYYVNLSSNFGYFSGTIRTDQGLEISFKDVFGFIEDFHARW